MAKSKSKFRTQQPKVEPQSNSELFVLDSTPTDSALPKPKLKLTTRYGTSKGLRSLAVLEPKTGGLRSKLAKISSNNDTDITKAKIVKLKTKSLPPPRKPEAEVTDPWIKPLVGRNAPSTYNPPSTSLIQQPHQGESYNPPAAAHAELVAAAVAAELLVQEQRAKDEAFRAKQRAAAMALEEPNLVGGMKVFDPATAEDSDSDEVAEGLAAQDTVKRSGPQRKTRAQKLSAIRLRDAAHLKKQDQERKNKLQSIMHIKSLLKATPAKPVRIPRPAKPERVEVTHPDELAPTLRELKTEGNLWRTSWDNLAKGNKMEKRELKMQRRKKNRAVIVEKKSFKRIV